MVPLPEKWRTIDEADEGHLEGVDRCRQLCFKLVKVLNQLGGRCLCNSVDCQELKNARCEGCELRWCCRCAHEAGECIVCEQAWARQHKANGNAHSESKNCKKIRKRTAPTTSVTNMHELGRNFVEEVLDESLDVRETEASTAEEAAKGHHLQFKCQIRGWKEETRAQVRAFLVGLKDVVLRQLLVRSNGRILFYFTADMWPTITPRYEKEGWWYAARDEVTYYECSACGDRKLEGQSEQVARSDADHQACSACATRRVRDAKRRARATPKARASARRAEGRPVRESQRRINYVELESSDDEIVWLTTSQIGWSIHAKEDEVVSSTDIEENRLTKRYIAPMISRFIGDRWIDGGEAVT